MSWDGAERRKQTMSCQQEILEKIASVERKIDRISLAIYGNGEPAKGFIVRMDRLEQTKSALLWTVAIIGTSVIGIIIHGIAQAMGR